MMEGQSTLKGFVNQIEVSKKVMTTSGVRNTKFRVKQVGKLRLHYKSHLNDPTLQPRRLEGNENIFDIIMPWLPDKEKEDLKNAEELLKL